MKAIQVAFGLLAAVAATAGHSADKVYKWKDANGIVHFSDAPPPKGTEFNNVRIVNQSTGITQSEPTAPAAPATDATTTAGAKPNPSSNAARCDNAQRRIAILSSLNPVTVQREGKVVELTAEERAAELNVSRATVDSFCPKTDQ
jgi:hypothetical protein